MKVMIVTKDALFGRLTSKKLETWGDECTVETTGTAAFERLKREPYRIVITEWDLQGLSADELCRKVRELERSRYTYIMVSTANKEKDVIMAGLEAGVDDFLDRPVNVVELRLKIKNAKRMLELEDELREGAGTDTMTGLVNFASFRQFFRVVLAETRRMKERGALMYVRVDDYPNLLADHGVGPAQTLMIEVSRALNRVIRSSDLVARISDEEFCMLLQNTYWDRCLPVAEKAMGLINNMTLYLEGVELRPKVTIGTVNYPADDLGPDDTLKITDRIPFEP